METASNNHQMGIWEDLSKYVISAGDGDSDSDDMTV